MTAVYALGKLYTSKLPEKAVDILYDRVLTFYEAHVLIYQKYFLIVSQVFLNHGV